jgi:adenine-specific DNA-methyltransferase
MSKQKEQFIALLGELFQLNQPELDFGLYRILHARSTQIKAFIDTELGSEIDAHFASQSQSNAHDALEAARVKVIEALGEDAILPTGEIEPGFRTSKVAKEYEQAQHLARDGGGVLADDAQVYEHLYRFFSRYYDKGDFMSKRYFVAENESRAAPYAVPYDGREVMLHWANKDQYFIKSSTTLNNFAFDLSTALIEEQGQQNELDFQTASAPLKVHFRLATATEGEHDNIKEVQERFFIVHSAEPLRLEKSDKGILEIVVQLEYRYDDEKPAKAGNWQQKRLAEVENTVREQLSRLAVECPEVRRFEQAMFSLAPTESQPTRTLLAKYLSKFTAPNTMDYFIHKNLGGFLRRELDFYIKNEIIRLDDIETADAPRVDEYLKKLRVLRKIARRIVDFLAQLEDFQKKLWLKKKFVVDTQYCITLDRIPESFYPEIAENKQQHEEWLKIFAIHEINANSEQSSYSDPLTSQFLTNNKNLVLDTKWFTTSFKDRLISEVSNLENDCAGLLIYSENFQGLNLLKTRLESQVDCIYIDPPYNTGKDGFPYKDGYRASSWLSMINDRIIESIKTLKQTAGFFVSCDENEHSRLSINLDNTFGANNSIANFIWKTDGNFDNQAKVKIAHEHILLYAKNESKFISPPVIEPGLSKDSKVFNAEIVNTIVKNGPKNPASQIKIPAGFPCSFESGVISAMRSGRSQWPVFDKDVVVDNFKTCHPVSAKSGWSSKAQCEEFINNDMQAILDQKGQRTRFTLTKTGAIESIKERSTDAGYVTSIIHSVGTTQSTSSFLEDAGLDYPFFPKPVDLVKYLAAMVKDSKVILDFFGGSGTTAHAVIKLFREDNIDRKYILIEQADHFDTVLLPRVKKCIYSQSWQEGKPLTRDSISHFLKYIRLESFEDTLNNLQLPDTPRLNTNSPDSVEMARDYLLKYWLEFETAGSPSLLNVREFTDPTSYKLKVKQPGSDAQVEKTIDLVETFNWLIGLHVAHLDQPRRYAIELVRETDPELPKDQDTRWRSTAIKERDDGEFWFRAVEGHILSVPGDDLSRERVLVIWRKLTGDSGRDQAALEAWLNKRGINPRESEFEHIYVNGNHALPSDGDAATRVRLIEETFAQRMWEDA